MDWKFDCSQSENMVSHCLNLMTYVKAFQSSRDYLIVSNCLRTILNNSSSSYFFVQVRCRIFWSVFSKKRRFQLYPWFSTSHVSEWNLSIEDFFQNWSLSIDMQHCSTSMSSSDTSDNTSLKSFGCKEEILSMSMFIVLITIWIVQDSCSDMSLYDIILRYTTIPNHCHVCRPRTGRDLKFEKFCSERQSVLPLLLQPHF